MNQICEEFDALTGIASPMAGTAASEAGKRYDEARKGLAAALDRGMDIYQDARRRVVRDTVAADGILHANLYRTVLIGIGVGVLVGFLVARSNTSGSD